MLVLRNGCKVDRKEVSETRRPRGITPLCGPGTITSSGIAQFKLQQTLSLYSLTKLLNTMVRTRKMTTLKLLAVMRFIPIIDIHLNSWLLVKQC